jgi:hypothetical protein
MVFVVCFQAGVTSIFLYADENSAKEKNRFCKREG